MDTHCTPAFTFIQLILLLFILLLYNCVLIRLARLEWTWLEVCLHPFKKASTKGIIVQSRLSQHLHCGENSFPLQKKRYSRSSLIYFNRISIPPYPHISEAQGGVQQTQIQKKYNDFKIPYGTNKGKNYCGAVEEKDSNVVCARDQLSSSQ